MSRFPISCVAPTCNAFVHRGVVGLLLAGAMVLGAAPSAIAQPTPISPSALIHEPEQPATARLDEPATSATTSNDRYDRLTLPITITHGGTTHGPYGFVIDSGSERSVIAREVAEAIGLPRGRPIRVVGMAGPAVVDSYALDGLRTPAIDMVPTQAPAFRQADLGAPGLIGIDLLNQYRVSFLFAAQRVDIRPAPRRRPAIRSDDDTIVVTGVRRAGRLILSGARIGNRPVRVILDTGSEVSVGNPALLRLIQRSQRTDIFPQTVIHSVTGETIPATYGRIAQMQIGGVTVNDIPVAFGDAYVFRALQLDDKPVLLLGMNVCRLFDRMDVDFHSRQVVFQLPEKRSR